MLVWIRVLQGLGPGDHDWRAVSGQIRGFLFDYLAWGIPSLAILVGGIFLIARGVPGFAATTPKIEDADSPVQRAD